jgi:3-oxoadipate enol-lactonase
MIDIGRGTPVVVIPGLQGRWEWMRPGVEALAEGHRAISYSLCDERASGVAWDPTAGFENYVRQLDEVLDRAELENAVLVGVSYGGLIALEYAARRPARVSGLVLASSLSPDWVPDRRAQFYMKAPRLLSPLFVATAPGRLGPEVRAAFPRLLERMRFAVGQTVRVTCAPMSPAAMARRIRWARAHSFADLATIAAPTLIVTGEPGLDRVVPVEVSRRLTDQMPGARHVILDRTGHLGIVTKPRRFVEVMDTWLGTPDRSTPGLKPRRSELPPTSHVRSAGTSAAAEAPADRRSLGEDRSVPASCK